MGIPNTKEQKRKISETLTGKPKSLLHRHNISRGKKGIPSPLKGRKRPLKVIEKIKASKVGKGNNREGYRKRFPISPFNELFRKRKEIKLWRQKVFERDDYTCQRCGERGGKLEAHHIKSFAKYPELRLKVSNGETLCERCHKKHHRKKK